MHWGDLFGWLQAACCSIPHIKAQSPWCLANMTAKLLNNVSATKLNGAIPWKNIHTPRCRKSVILIVTILIKLMRLRLTGCALDLLFCSNSFISLCVCLDLSTVVCQTCLHCLPTVNSFLHSFLPFLFLEASKATAKTHRLPERCNSSLRKRGREWICTLLGGVHFFPRYYTEVWEKNKVGLGWFEQC